MQLNRNATRLGALFVVCFFSALAYALVGLKWPETIRFTGGGLSAFLLCAALGLVASSALLKAFRLSNLGIALAAIAVVSVITGSVSALLTVAAITLSASIVGGAVLRVLRANTLATTHPHLCCIVGLGFVGTAVSVLVHLPVNFPGVYAALLAIPFWFGRRNLPQLLETLKDACIDRSGAEGVSILRAAIGGFASVYALVAFMPELGHDALAMHLFIPAQVTANGKWAFDFQSYVWALFPALADWILTVAFMFGGESAARLTNIGFIAFLAFQASLLAKWAGGSESAAKWAWLLTLSAPLTFLVGSSLFIESIWTSFLLAGTYVILLGLYDDVDRASALVLGGTLLGFAAATKAVTFTFLPVLVVLLMVKHKVWLDRRFAKHITVGLIAFIAIGSLPYLVAYVKSGNPVFPMYNRIFQSPYFALENFRDARFPVGITWRTLWDITFNTDRHLESFRGGIGFHWWVFLVPALAGVWIARSQRGMVLAFIGIGAFSICFSAMAYVRYAFPALLVCTAVTAVFVGALLAKKHFSSYLALTVASLVVGGNALFLSNSSAYGEFPWRAAFSAQSRAAFLEQASPVRAAAAAAESINVSRSPIAVFASPYVSGISTRVLYPSWYNYRFLNSIRESSTPEELAAKLNEWGVDLIVLDTQYRDVPSQLVLLAEAASAPVLTFSGVSVRRVRAELLYRKELLKNTKFLVAGEGWGSLPTARGTTGGIIVNSANATHQTVSIKSGRSYRHEVAFGCASNESPPKGQARLQLRWLDASSIFLKVDSAVFDCAQEVKTSNAVFRAPAGAAFVEVWATSHNEIPIELIESSLRE